MIELKNITKIYQAKKGASTTAINNINLKIEKTGMVFIVGKSGSGKSTLLNLLGGLDTATTGEIVINENNINQFNKQQYDSYRNTYIGFVFQEFNILEQYNVYENIEIALKLQGKESTKDELDTLLNKLGLNNLGNRKINELSGGQKQRVAIARALIKKPHIILADEPTGNLDQESSKQIFSILKDISKTQLVIVVSHDMESAKIYADRIIEIEDGNIKSDSKPTTIIQPEIVNFKKSKLPLLYALKMSTTSFKTKPIKLIMTILLTTISLIFMALTVNCALFDDTRLKVNVIKDNNNYLYEVYNTKVEPLGAMEILVLNSTDLQNIRQLTNGTLNPGYVLYDNGEKLNFTFGEKNDRKDIFPSPNYPYFIEVIDTKVLGKMIGNAPQKNNEIVIHKYLADYIIKYGVTTSSNELYFPDNYEDLVLSNKELKIGENNVIITGIIDDDKTAYEDSLQKGYFVDLDLDRYYHNHYVQKGKYIYVKGFTESAILRENKEYILKRLYLNRNETSITSLNALTTNVEIISKNGKETINSLNKQEAIISIDVLKKFDKNFTTNFEYYLAEHNNGIYSELLQKFILQYVTEENVLSTLSSYLYDGTKGTDKKINIIGVSLDNNNYISYQYVEEYEPITKEMYFVQIYENNISTLNKVFENLPLREMANDGGTYYTIGMEHDTNIAYVILIYRYLAIYTLITSLVFVLFTLLLFSNFISVSISYCKKEIGILRALGATTIDIIKIFGYESIIIAITSWFFSLIGWTLVQNLLNNALFGDLYFTLNGIMTHPLVPIGTLIFAIIFALLITIISTSKITKIQPIDAILNK